MSYEHLKHLFNTAPARDLDAAQEYFERRCGYRNFLELLRTWTDTSHRSDVRLSVEVSDSEPHAPLYNFLARADFSVDDHEPFLTVMVKARTWRGRLRFDLDHALYYWHRTRPVTDAATFLFLHHLFPASDKAVEEAMGSVLQRVRPSDRRALLPNAVRAWGFVGPDCEWISPVFEHAVLVHDDLEEGTYQDPVLRDAAWLPAPIVAAFALLWRDGAVDTAHVDWQPLRRIGVEKIEGLRAFLNKYVLCDEPNRDARTLAWRALASLHPVAFEMDYPIRIRAAATLHRFGFDRAQICKVCDLRETEDGRLVVPYVWQDSKVHPQPTPLRGTFFELNSDGYCVARHNSKER